MSAISASGAATGPTLDVIPLGGLGEFGMNMLLVVWDDTAILIDAGAMFPGPELLGVDLVVPNLGCLQERVGRLAAVVLTHGNLLADLAIQVEVQRHFGDAICHGLGSIPAQIDDADADAPAFVPAGRAPPGGGRGDIIDEGFDLFAQRHAEHDNILDRGLGRFLCFGE